MVWQEVQLSWGLHAWQRLTRAATQGLPAPGPQRDARVAAAAAALAQGAGSSDPAPAPDEEPFAAADRQRLTVSRRPAACACGAAAARLVARLCAALPAEGEHARLQFTIGVTLMTQTARQAVIAPH